MSEEILIKQCIYESCTDIKEINKLVAYFEQLQQENQQLKESYCNRTDCSGRLHDSKKYPSVKQQLDLYKSVLDEIREYIEKETIYNNYNEVYRGILDSRNVNHLLKILDKVKE